MDLNFDLQPMQFSHFAYLLHFISTNSRRKKHISPTYTISYLEIQNICTKHLTRNSLIFWFIESCQGRKVNQISTQFPLTYFRLLFQEFLISQIHISSKMNSWLQYGEQPFSLIPQHITYTRYFIGIQSIFRQKLFAVLCIPNLN